MIDVNQIQFILKAKYLTIKVFLQSPLLFTLYSVAYIKDHFKKQPRKLKVKILESEFYTQHTKLIVESFENLTQTVFPIYHQPNSSTPQDLFNSDYCILSHGLGPSPIFNFASQKALDLFEITWEELLKLPSSRSAEALEKIQRQKLLDEVTQNGFISNYKGIRISSSGKRFWIKKAIVWNLIDKDKKTQGQAALFNEWEFITN